MVCSIPARLSSSEMASDNRRVTLCSIIWRISACLRCVMSLMVLTTPAGAVSEPSNNGCALVASQSTVPSGFRMPMTTLDCG